MHRAASGVEAEARTKKKAPPQREGAGLTITVSAVSGRQGLLAGTQTTTAEHDETGNR